MHAAGVLSDGVYSSQTWDRFVEALHPKVFGGWNLHLLTRDLPIDYFVLFSSCSATVANAGQSNHASANYFLDSLAHHRYGLGKVAGFN